MRDSDSYNRNDLIIWEKVFENIPSEWKKVEPSDSMNDCLNFFKQNNIHTVLDLGCGIGIWSIFLGKYGLTVKGVDFSKNAIKFAREWSKKEKINVVFECSPLINHSFKKILFDGIVAAKILDNISKLEFVEVKRGILSNLKMNGILFCLFNPQISEINEIKNSKNPTEGITHIIYSDEELKQLFPDMILLDFKYYEHGFRGMVLQKKNNIVANDV